MNDPLTPCPGLIHRLAGVFADGTLSADHTAELVRDARLTALALLAAEARESAGIDGLSYTEVRAALVPAGATCVVCLHSLVDALAWARVVVLTNGVTHDHTDTLRVIEGMLADMMKGLGEMG